MPRFCRSPVRPGKTRTGKQTGHPAGYLFHNYQPSPREVTAFILKEYLFGFYGFFIVRLGTPNKTWRIFKLFGAAASGRTQWFLAQV